ncbi:hypothetical protein BGZ67_005028 [Mortierella alpina]|nr:hypothetical protein BGZ67_005028 [Mortierella alpina]
MSSARAPITHHATTHASQDARSQPAPEPKVLYGTSIDYQERRQRIRMMPPSPPASQNPFNAPTIHKLETMFDRVLALAQAVKKTPARPALSPASPSSSSSPVLKRPNAFHPYRPLHRPLHYPGKPEEQDTIAAHPTLLPVRSQKRAERVLQPPTRSVWSTLSSESQPASETRPGPMKSGYRHLLPPADATTESLLSHAHNAQDSHHQHSISRVVNDLSEQSLLAPKPAALPRPKPPVVVEREESPRQAANGGVDSDSSVVELLSSDNEEDIEDDADEALEEIDNHPGEEHDYEDYDSEEDYEDEEEASDQEPEDEDYEPEEIVDLDDSDEEEDLRRRQRNEQNRLLRGSMGIPRQPPVAEGRPEAYQQSKVSSDDDAEHSQDDAEVETPSVDGQEDVESNEGQDEYSDSNMEDKETAFIRQSVELKTRPDESVESPARHVSRDWSMESAEHDDAGGDDRSNGDAVLLLDSDDDEALGAEEPGAVAFEDDEEPYSDAEHDSQDQDDYITDSSVGEDEDGSGNVVELESEPYELDDDANKEQAEEDHNEVQAIEDIEDVDDVEDLGEIKGTTVEEGEEVDPDNDNMEVHIQSAQEEDDNDENEEVDSTPAQLLKETMEFLRSSDSAAELDESSQNVEVDPMHMGASASDTVEEHSLESTKVHEEQDLEPTVHEEQDLEPTVHEEQDLEPTEVHDEQDFEPTGVLEEQDLEPTGVHEEQDLPVLEMDGVARSEAMLVEQHGAETLSAVMDAGESIDIPGAVGFGDMVPLRSLADPDNSVVIDFSTDLQNTSTVSDLVQQSIVDMETSPSTTEQVTIEESQTVSISLTGQFSQQSEEPVSTVSTSTLRNPFVSMDLHALDQGQESILPVPQSQYATSAQESLPTDSNAAHVSLLERLRAVAHEEGVALSSFAPMPSQARGNPFAENYVSSPTMGGHQQLQEPEETFAREISVPLPPSDFALPSGGLSMELGMEESDSTTAALSPLQPRKTRLARTGTMAQTVREGKAFIEHAEAKQGSVTGKSSQSSSTAPLTLEDLTGPVDDATTVDNILEPSVATPNMNLQPPNVRRGELALLVEEARAFCSGVPTPSRAGSSLVSVVSPSSAASMSTFSTMTEADLVDLAAQSANARGMSPSRLLGFARRRVSLTSSTTETDNRPMDRSSNGSGSEPQHALSSSISSTTSSGSSSYQQVVTPRKVGVVDLAAEKVIQSTVVGSHALRPFINPPSPAGSGLAGSRSNSQEPTFSAVSPPHSQVSPFFTFGQTPLGITGPTTGGGATAGGAGAPLGSASVGFGFGSSFVATKEKKNRVTSPVIAFSPIKAPSPKTSPTKASTSTVSQHQQQGSLNYSLKQEIVQPKHDHGSLSDKGITTERDEQAEVDRGQDEAHVDGDEEDEEAENDVEEDSDVHHQQQQQEQQEQQKQQEVEDPTQNNPGSIFVRMAKRKRSPSSSRNKNQQRRAAKKLLKQQTSSNGAGDSNKEEHRG